MDKFDSHRGGGDRYRNTTIEDPHHYRHSRGDGPPIPPPRLRRDNTPHDYRTGFSTAGAGRGTRENYRPFSSPPRYPHTSTADRGTGGGGLRPIDDGIEGLRRPVGGGEGFGSMLVTGGRGFRPIGGGFRQMDGDEFQRIGGSVGRGFADVAEGLRPMGGGWFQSAGGGVVDGVGFQPMGGSGNDGGGLRPIGSTTDAAGFQPVGVGDSDGERYGLDNYPMPPPPLAGQKRGYPFTARERSPDRGGGSFAKLFVGSVPRTATDEDIRPLFEKHGNVLEVALIKDKRTGQQQGCCFVKYASSEEADRAIRALHNQYTLPGGMGPIQVRYADGERERLGATEYKLFVGSLSRQATEKEVEEIFSPYGRVEDVYIMRDEMKQSRGCGFVKYSQREMAQAAINALNGAYTMRGCNQPLIVRFADPKRPRPGESRGAPFSGPGFGPRFSAPVIRPPPDQGEPLHGPISSWPSQSPNSLGPPSHGGPHAFGNQFPAGSGDMTVSAKQVPIGGLPGNANCSLTGVTVASAPPSQMNMNQPLSQGQSIGSKISTAQRPLQSPQHLPTFMHLQGSHMQPGQMQTPQPTGQALYGGLPSSQQLPGRNGQLPVPHAQVQPNAPTTPGQVPVVAVQPPPPGQQLQPFSQSPSQLAQMLSQQKQTLQATFQSSQQTLNQLQQQVQQLQPSNKNISAHQGPVAAKEQSTWAGTLPQPGALGVQPARDLGATASPLSNVPSVTPAITAAYCNWTEHTSPDGYKYYYNSVTGESKWEKPEELTLSEQQQQQQQQKPSNQQAQVQSHPSGPLTQQTQMQVQFHGQQHSQLHNRAKPLHQSSQSSQQELGYSQLHPGAGPVNPSQYQQSGQAAQEWMWKNKHSGTS